MDLYRRIFESMPDGLFVVGPDGRVLRANAQAARMFGYEQAELVGQPIELLVPQQLRDRHVEHRERYSAEPRARPMGIGLELQGRRKDESEFPVDIMLSPIDSADCTGVLCAVRDVTDRRRADERFRALLEAAPDAMVIVDEQGSIILVNTQTERVFGYPRHELLRRPVEVLIPERLHEAHRQQRRRYLEAPDAETLGARPEFYGRRRDGSEFPVEIGLSRLATDEGTLISSAIRDITDRKRVERVMELLREKELMLKEIHHRVKNNLAIISSLFYLQSTYTNDERTLRLLRDSQERVRTMSLVHESLYRSENLAAIDFGAYAASLSEHLMRSYRPTPDDVRLRTRLDHMELGIDLAIPCGLILNELMTNALTHAFPPGRRGEVWVESHRTEEGRWAMSVTDDGVGLPDGLVIENASTLGLRLIRSLSRQINARFELRRVQPGTRAILTLETN